MAKRTEPFLGIVLKYNVNKEHTRQRIEIKPSADTIEEISVGFIGAGSYAQGSLLPNLPKDITRKGVMTNSGTTSKRVAERFGFEFCTSNEDDILKSEDINTIFIATRHDSHAKYVIEGIKNGKNVYVEKPLCLTLEELVDIQKMCTEKDKSVMIGFNRRFAPLAQKIKKHFGDGKMSMVYRVNAGVIPSDSWIQDITIGGGRMIGEGCHFIDFMAFMCGSIPIKVSAMALPDCHGLNDTVNVLIEFENGSTGVLAYYANGSKLMPKEYFEVYSSGMTATLNDFKECTIYGKKQKKYKLATQDKGQKNMVAEYITGLRNGQQPIPQKDIFATTAATFGILRSLSEGGSAVSIII